MGMDPIISLPGLATTAITGTLTLTKPGTTPRTMTFPDASIEVQSSHEIQSSGWQARNHGLYTAIASATVTDPGTPAAGHEFTTLVRNGTLTTSRDSYGVSGTLVRSVWHSGSWTDYPYGPLNAANTWTAAQTIDRGTGALPATVGGTGVLTLANADVTPARIESFGFNTTGLQWRARISGGTRATLAATPGGTAFYNIAANGYDGTSWNDAGVYQTQADGTWSGTNRGIAHIWQGTPNGSTTTAEWMRLQNGNLGIGVTPTAGNGLLQLASGVTKANGIAAGTDTFFFRDSAGSWKIGGQNTNASLQVDGANSGTNGGSFVVTRLNGAALCGIGNWSALIGGAHDATPTIFGGGNIRIAPNGVIAQTVKGTGQTRFLPLSADPAGAENGDVYYNSTTNKLRVYNGAWVDLH